GAWRKVVELCEELLAQIEEPRERAEMMIYLAEVAYYQLDKRAAAVSWLESAVESDVDFEPPLLWLQKLYREDDNWQAEMKLLGRHAHSSASLATRTSALVRMAELAEQRSNDSGEALEYLNQALDEVFRSFPAFEQIVRILRDRSEWAALETQYRKMISRSKSLTYSLNRQLGEIQDRGRVERQPQREVEVTSTIRIAADLAEAIPQSIEIADALFHRIEDPTGRDSRATFEGMTGAVDEEQSVSQTQGAVDEGASVDGASAAGAATSDVISGVDDTLEPASKTTESAKPSDRLETRAETPESDANPVPADEPSKFSEAATDELSVSTAEESIDGEESDSAPPRRPASVVQSGEHVIVAPPESDPDTPREDASELPRADWAAIEPTQPAIAVDGAASKPPTQGGVELRSRVHWEARLPTHPRVDIAEVSDAKRASLYQQLDEQRERGDVEGSMDTLEALERLESDPHDRVFLAIELAELAQGALEHVGRAEAALMRVLENDPDNLVVLERLLQLYLLTEDKPAAIDCLLRLIQIEEDKPRRAELRTALGQLYAASDELTRAISSFGKALLDDPDNERAHELLNDVVEMHGDWHKLEEVYLALLSAPEILNPDRLFALNLATGDLYRTRLMNLERAAHHFELCIAAQPQSLDLRESLCELYEILGLADERFLERSIEHQRLVLSLDPLRESTLHGLLESQRNVGALDAAFRVGQLLAATGRASEAERAFLNEHARLDLPTFRHAFTDEQFAQGLVPVGMDTRINRLMALISRLEYRFVPVQTPSGARVLGYGHQFRHVLQEISPLFERMPPEVFKCDGDELRAIGKPIALIVGQSLLSTPDLKRWGFLIGRALCHLRPEFFLLSYGADAARNCIAAAVNFAVGGERVTDTSQSLRFFDHFDRLGIEER
ncbi:MAG: hypothetical protein KC609_01150, partial [Myxococcales bacterium]|nr:hypothetical protein [Myxococcales bacterium]